MQTAVRSIFLMPDTQQVIVHLRSTEWNCSFGAALLRNEKIQVRGRQVGFGDTGGDVTVLFQPEELWSQVEIKLAYLSEHPNDIFLEQTESGPEK